MNSESDRRFGWAWLIFAVSLACHVMDEAAHDFLSSVYNPNALWLRARFHLPFPPTFTFREWIVGLGVGVLLLLCLTPLAWRGARVLRIVALPLGLVIGIGNGLGHVISSFYFHRLMPGVISGPLIIATGMLLVVAAVRKEKGSALGRASIA
jgi:hypothetical protein